MPSTIQSLIIVFARLIILFPKEILSFLMSVKVIDTKTNTNKSGLKVLMDKWLLHQPSFKGLYFKNVTLQALVCLFNMKDNIIETLMVIGFNPSHSKASIGKIHRNTYYHLILFNIFL